jgi:hypothetical protein
MAAKKRPLIKANGTHSIKGSRFWKSTRAMENRCQRVTELTIPGMGKKAPLCVEALGRVLIDGDILGACMWGCPGDEPGGHVIHYLCARSVSFGRAAMRLAKLAFYDEALSLVRSVREIANLLALFAADKTALEQWKKRDRKYRQAHFSPMQVRVRLETLKELIPMEEDRYRTLCEVSTHPVPELTPQQFNPHKKSMAGGLHVQPAGFLVVLNELALLESLAIFYSARLCSVPKEARMQVFKDCSNLAKVGGGVNVENFRDMLRGQPPPL